MIDTCLAPALKAASRTARRSTSVTPEGARELADHFGLSESGFKLYCQNVLGEGYLAYFRRRRLERAAELLRTTPQRVQDIAARVGYESQGRFAQAFYDQFRLTPLEYRRLSK